MFNARLSLILLDFKSSVFRYFFEKISANKYKLSLSSNDLLLINFFLISTKFINKLLNSSLKALNVFILSPVNNTVINITTLSLKYILFEYFTKHAIKLLKYVSDSIYLLSVLSISTVPISDSFLLIFVNITIDPYLTNLKFLRLNLSCVFTLTDLSILFMSFVLFLFLLSVLFFVLLFELDLIK